MYTKWMRRCQECLHKQTDTEPQGNITNAYANRKCKVCKSSALDYGRLVTFNDEGKELSTDDA